LTKQVEADVASGVKGFAVVRSKAHTLDERIRFGRELTRVACRRLLSINPAQHHRHKGDDDDKRGGILSGKTFVGFTANT
jgi:hypothetical protein